jgi:hypothetical protein
MVWSPMMCGTTSPEVVSTGAPSGAAFATQSAQPVVSSRETLYTR